jgi:hypothetical protein
MKKNRKPCGLCGDWMMCDVCLDLQESNLSPEERELLEYLVSDHYRGWHGGKGTQWTYGLIWEDFKEGFDTSSKSVEEVLADLQEQGYIRYRFSKSKKTLFCDCTPYLNNNN